MITEKTMRDAYVFLRQNNNTIPDETLDFMLHASIEKLKENETTHDASQKRYSKEDLEKAMLAYGKWITGAWPSFGFVSTTEEAKEKIIKYLFPTETHDVSNVDSEEVKNEIIKVSKAALDTWNSLSMEFRDISEYSDYEIGFIHGTEWQQSQINKNK